MLGKSLRLGAKAAIALLCLLFVLLPEVRLPGTAGSVPESELRHAGYHQQHPYAPPAAQPSTPAPDTTALPLFPWLPAAPLALVPRSPHADSRIPILRKHRMLRPLKFRGSFLPFPRIPNAIESASKGGNPNVQRNFASHGRASQAGRPAHDSRTAHDSAVHARLGSCRRRPVVFPVIDAAAVQAA